ncbi:hypothetical protein DYB37_008860 [Aphanomyces astaci]|uniref:TOG domain-containing protein n=1 Tax=Aphanomyces astaci TaxID=112090 RepID=A0A3R6XFU5_APHAT|nr:hypothetical protein DYB37_008860 [Aphanomyces astaci]
MVLHSTLKPAIEAVIQKLGDSKPRVRSDSFAVLHAVSTLSHIGPGLVGGFVMEQFHATDAPVAKTEMLMLLTSLLRESKATCSKAKGDYSSSSNTSDHAKAAKPTAMSGNLVDLAQVLDIIVPALDNKHVDIRNAAVAAYTALYELVKAIPTTKTPPLDIHACLAHVKPAVREAISKNILTSSSTSSSPSTCAPMVGLPLADNTELPSFPEVESARGCDGGGDGSLELDKVAIVFGAEVASLLAHPATRRQGLVQLMTKLMSMPSASPLSTAAGVTYSSSSSSTQRPWEVSCLLAKTMLLDTNVAVVLTTLQLLTTVAGTGGREITASLIPWGEWGVHLVLGSTVRSVLQQAAHPAVRVRLAVKQWLQVLVHRHTLGRTVVVTALLDTLRQAAHVSGTSTRGRRLQHIRVGWELVVRLEMLDDMLQNDPPSDLVAMDNVLPFLGASCVGHGSATVRQWVQTLLMWFHSQDAPRLTKALHGSGVPHARQLMGLLADAAASSTVGSTDTVPPSAVHVRTSRMSHVRRVAALRGGPGDDSPRCGGGSNSSDDNDPTMDVVTRSTTKTHQMQMMATKPLWLRDKTDDTDGAAAVAGVGGGPLGRGLGGGASGLVKARRTSRTRNNHDDDDVDHHHMQAPTPQQQPPHRRVHVGLA